MTEWRVIPGYPDYEASDDGNIRRIKNGYILSPIHNQTGHRYVQLKRKNKTVARLVYWAFHPDFPENNDLLVIRHIDEDPENDSLDNLEWYERGELVEEIEPYNYPGNPRGAASPKYGHGNKNIIKPIPIEIIETGEIFPSANDVAKYLESLGWGYFSTGYILRISHYSDEAVRGLHFRRLPRE